jgi:hypothetical protein
MRSLPAWRSASSALALLVVAGCGGQSPPRLAHADAAPLIALAARIAGERPCAQARDIPRLSARTIALVNAHRVPAALQEPLLAGVNDLSAQAPLCLPSVPPGPTAATTTTRTEPGPPPAPDRGKRGRGHGHGRGHGGGHGKGEG